MPINYVVIITSRDNFTQEVHSFHSLDAADWFYQKMEMLHDANTHHVSFWRLGDALPINKNVKG